MIGDVSALPALARTLRNRLWLERARQALRPGLAVAAALLLATAVCHLWLHPVSWRIWLPLIFLSPLLSLAAVVILGRPGLAEAIAVYDARRAMNEFLISAWEAWQTPAGSRGAGARAVLAEFEARSTDIDGPGRYPGAPGDSQRQALQSTATWMALVAALFMLQLPGHPAPGTASAPAPEPTGDGERSAGLFTEPERQGGSGTASPEPGRVGAETELELAEREAAEPPPEILRPLDTSAEDEGKMAAGREPAGESPAVAAAQAAAGDPAQTAPRRGAAADGDSGIERPDRYPRPPDPELEKRYAAIARGIADRLTGSIAGSEGVEVSAASPDSNGPVATAGVDLRHHSAWSSQFSLAQRRWIAAYFERLEDKP